MHVQFQTAANLQARKNPLEFLMYHTRLTLALVPISFGNRCCQCLPFLWLSTSALTVWANGRCSVIHCTQLAVLFCGDGYNLQRYLLHKCVLEPQLPTCTGSSTPNGGQLLSMTPDCLDRVQAHHVSQMGVLL